MKINKKIIFTLLFVVIFFVFSPVKNIQAFSGTGSGLDADNAFLITTCEQLQEMRDDLDAFYKLANNIDCLETSGWNDGAGFLPVGSSLDPFIGNLNGDNYIISNLFIDNYNGSGGLFFRTINATISNVSLVDVEIFLEENVGGLVGSGSAIISNSYTTGSIYGEENVGGLFGYFEGGIITDSYSTASITGEFNYAGGLIGYLADGEISNSYATGSVEGGDNLGGFIGYMTGGLVGSCYATGNVTGVRGYIGGFVGHAGGGDITDNYARGNVEGSDFSVGGFAGQLQTNVENCYATGNVSGENSVGGFVGDLSTEGEIFAHSSFSTGSVIGSGFSVGGFAGYEYANFDNCGWVVQEGLNAIGETFNGEESIGIAEIAYNETEESAFFNKNHLLYTSYEDAQWDFGTISEDGDDPVWEENSNNYPTLFSILADNEEQENNNEEENDQEEVEKARIISWKAYKYEKTKGSSCSEKIKLVIKGRHFDKNAVVKIGNKKASSVEKRSSQELVAKFCLTDLLKTKTDFKRKIHVINPDSERETAKKEINLKKINYENKDEVDKKLFSSQNSEGIKNIQNKLIQLGLLDLQFPTGFYGPMTVEAVKKFQQQNGLPQTGFVGELTKTKLTE